MKYLGCPVIGDSKYSTNDINSKFKVYSQMLFAAKYTFDMPVSSPLCYLNEVVIDITSDILDKIQKVICD